MLASSFSFEVSCHHFLCCHAEGALEGYILRPEEEVQNSNLLMADGALRIHTKLLGLVFLVDSEMRSSPS